MIEYYNEIKFLHVACAIISLVLFILRGYWAITSHSLASTKWAKVLPHPIDTLLLGAGITLAVLLQQYPFVDAWLTAKVIALIIFIVAGWLALRAKTKQKRLQAYIVAITVFIYIAWVALTKNAYVMGSMA